MTNLTRNNQIELLRPGRLDTESNALTMTLPLLPNPSGGGGGGGGGGGEGGILQQSQTTDTCKHRPDVHCLQTLSSQLYMYFRVIKTFVLVLTLRQSFIQQYRVYSVSNSGDHKNLNSPGTIGARWQMLNLLFYGRTLWVQSVYVTGTSSYKDDLSLFIKFVCRQNNHAEQTYMSKSKNTIRQPQQQTQSLIHSDNSSIINDITN